MRYLFTCLLVVALAVCFAAPALAATTADDQASSLQNGWSIRNDYVGASSGYSNSFFYACLRGIQQIWYRLDLMHTSINQSNDYLKTTDSNVKSIYQVVNGLNTIMLNLNSHVNNIDSNISSIKSSVDSMKSNVSNSSTYLQSIYTDIGQVEVHTDNIARRIVDVLEELRGVHSDTSSIDTTTQGIHSDTTSIDATTQGIHSDTTSIDTTTQGIHSDTSSIDATTKEIKVDTGSIEQAFVKEKYVVNDYDEHNIFAKTWPVIAMQDTNKFVRFDFGYSGGSNFPKVVSQLRIQKELVENKLYSATFPASVTSLTFPAGTYRLDNCDVLIKYVGSSTWMSISDGYLGTSVIVDIPKDFTLHGVRVRAPAGYKYELNTVIPVGFFGPLEVEGTNGLLNVIANKLALLQFTLADTDSVNAKLKNQGVIDSATEDFFSGTDSPTSLGTGGLGNIKSVGSQIGSALDSGASASDFSSALNEVYSESGGLGWFSSATADDLDTVPVTYSRSSTDVIVTDYVSQYQSAVTDWFLNRGDADDSN